MTFGAIEAGGTKFVCAFGSGPDDLSTPFRIPTTTPEVTLARCVEYFRDRCSITALGVGCFGPLDLDPRSTKYGFVTKTTKPGWSDTDVVGTLARALRVPVGFDTDVNAALLGEARWGAARGMDSAVYVTVGTGIGGGACVNGSVVHGLVHPEMGHLFVPREANDSFAGVCPFHAGRCWEGVASGPAIRERWGQPAEELPDDHPAWELEARYLASGLASLVLTLSPHRIVLGGGVAQNAVCLPLVRRFLLEALAGYVDDPRLTDRMDEFLVAPALGARSGVLGALVLAEKAATAD